jgi:1L-myo-inositol 1-phosphate cytidylyltransferase / CDP-L-myo-inositol myo-inositolphosphotransferase
MTRAATLVLAPADDAAPGSPTRETMLLGLPLVRRTTLAASRAGFDRVHVLGAGGVDAGWNEVPELPPGRIVLLPDRVAASPEWLRSLREAPAEPERLYRLGAGAIVETLEPAPLARALARRSGLSSVLSEWAAALPSSPSAATVEPPLEVTNEAALAEAETRLLRGLVKKQDGLLTRLISRKISLAATRRLAKTSITPNAMTLVCLTLGLLGAWSFASPSPPRQIAGGVLFLLHSILDGCDGELARLKFQESRFGGMLDFFCDNLVHVAVFSAFAIAWKTASGQAWPLLLGVLAVSSTILSAGFIYFYAMRPRKGGGPLLTTVSPAHRSRLAAVLDALTRRDFIYLVMLFALFGKAYWFLLPVAIGTPVFFAALLVMAAGSRRPAPTQ